MNRLALLALCGVLSCTHPSTQEPQPVSIPADGARVVPIQADAPRAMAIDAPARSPADELERYAMAVGRAIKARLIVPSNVPDTASAVYEITVARNGAVAQLRRIKTSGFPAYDAAIRRAIRRAQPFPPPAAADSAKPLRVQLTFKVKE